MPIREVKYCSEMESEAQNADVNCGNKSAQESELRSWNEEEGCDQWYLQ